MTTYDEEHPFAVIRSLPNPKRAICVDCEQSVMLKIGWPPGSYGGWSRDEADAGKGIWVQTIMSPIPPEALSFAESYFRNPVAPNDPPEKHNHRPKMEHLIAQFGRKAAQNLKEVKKEASGVLTEDEVRRVWDKGFSEGLL